MINAWYLKNAPWKQIDRKANNEGRFAENWENLEEQCREIIELRMKLIPYFHAAFVNYHQQGIPPFRALVMDYPRDPAVRNISNQFLVGENMLVAPVTESESKRKVYLPEGDWYHFFTLQKYSGKAEYTLDVPLYQIPVFIKSGTILPLAKPTLHTEDPDSWKLAAMVFGENAKPAILFEDDGSLAPELEKVKLIWNSKTQKGEVEREGKPSEHQYSVISTPRCLFSLYHWAKNVFSSRQFGHQLPKIVTTTTFPVYLESLSATCSPFKLGKVKSMVV